MTLPQTPTSLDVSNERVGVVLRILSTLAFALMGVFVKALGDTVPLGQVVFFRSAVAMLPLVAYLWWRGDWPRGLRTSRPMGHIGRCLMGAAAMFTSFATIRLLPLAEATMLTDPDLVDIVDPSKQAYFDWMHCWCEKGVWELEFGACALCEA